MLTEYKDKHGTEFIIRDKPNGDPIRIPRNRKGHLISSATWAAAIQRKSRAVNIRQADGSSRTRHTRMTPREQIDCRQTIERHIYLMRIEELARRNGNVSEACRELAAAEVAEQNLPSNFDITQQTKDRANQIRSIYYNAKRAKKPLD